MSRQVALYYLNATATLRWLWTTGYVSVPACVFAKPSPSSDHNAQSSSLSGVVPRSPMMASGSSVDLSSEQARKLQLPASCDPPQPGSPTKQQVWVVSSSLRKQWYITFVV